MPIGAATQKTRIVMVILKVKDVVIVAVGKVIKKAP
jgi:hypothetical protein